MKLLDQYRRRISLGIRLEAQRLDVFPSSLMRTVGNGAPSLPVIPDVL